MNIFFPSFPSGSGDPSANSGMSTNPFRPGDGLITPPLLTIGTGSGAFSSPQGVTSEGVPSISSPICKSLRPQLLEYGVDQSCGGPQGAFSWCRPPQPCCDAPKTPTSGAYLNTISEFLSLSVSDIFDVICFPVQSPGHWSLYQKIHPLFLC